MKRLLSWRKRAYFKDFFAQLDALDRKRYISEVMSAPESAEGRQWAEALRVITKSMNDEMAAYDKASREYREYIEMWVHEIKTPISGAQLICENNGYADVLAELSRIERFVEQALFYARSGSLEKDYLIQETDLGKLARDLCKDNASALIARKIKLSVDVDGTILTDSKWLTFILRQLLDNAMKYGATEIGFRFSDNVLTITDNGIGIPAEDLPRIFERGFTGGNGRSYPKSTGMGLYICKQLCEKMGLELTAQSQNGVQISIRFPSNPFLSFL
jgi:signal transduction histidine kinase